MSILGDPSDKSSDSFTQGAKVRRAGAITSDTWAWIRTRKPCLNVAQTAAVIEELERVERERDALRDGIVDALRCLACADIPGAVAQMTRTVQP